MLIKPLTSPGVILQVDHDHHLKTAPHGCPLRRVPHEIGSNHLEATEPPVENVEFAIGGFCILQRWVPTSDKWSYYSIYRGYNTIYPIFEAIYRDYSSMYD